MNDRRITDTYQEDGISLIDIWRVLVKHKKAIFLVWALISLGGVIVAVLIPEKYAYTTLVEISRLSDEAGKGNLMETADEVRVRLVAGIIPVVQRRFLGEGKDAHDINVKVPEKSPLFLLLESRGSAQSAPGHLAFHGAVVETLRQEHQSILNKAREALGAQQETVKRKIAELQDERVLLAARFKRLDEEGAYLKKRVEQSKVTIASATRLGEKAVSQKAGEDITLAYMTINTQIVQQQSSLARLEERLLLDLPGERVEISKAIADNARAVDEQRSALNIIASRLGRIHETRTVLPPTQSVSPVASNGRHIIMLAILAGLMLGVLGAFLVEFLLKARKEAGTAPS